MRAIPVSKFVESGYPPIAGHREVNIPAKPQQFSSGEIESRRFRIPKGAYQLSQFNIRLKHNGANMLA